MHQPDNWGWKARIGMFIVSSEAVPEAEWWAMMPPGVSVHAARIKAPTPWAKWNGAGCHRAAFGDCGTGNARHDKRFGLRCRFTGEWSETSVPGLSGLVRPERAREGHPILR